MQLRDYQKNLITQIGNGLREHKSVCLQLPTGAGKTVIFSFIVKAFSDMGKRSLVLVHRRELVKQTVRTLKEVGCNVGVIASGMDSNPQALVQVASVQTLIRRLDIITEPYIIIADECHHVPAGSWASIHNTFSSFRLGVSASPARLDSKGLNDFYKSLINGPTIKQLTAMGFLCPYKLYAPKNNLDLTGIKTVMGDYEKTALEEAVMRPSVTGCVVSEYLKRANGKRAIMFAASIKHSKELVTQLQSAGVRAMHLDADSDKELRDNALDLLSSGDIDVVSNVGLFSEGLDIKAVECVIDASPTQSLVNYMQRVGRALRPFEGKQHAIILDLAGNCYRHGMPDQDREWSLQGIEKKKRGKNKDEPSVKICEKCFAACESTNTVCPECGFVFPIQHRQIEEREGELDEITKIEIKKKKKLEQAQCSTYEELVALGTKRGYSNPHGWAHFIYEGRKRRY